MDPRDRIREFIVDVIDVLGFGSATFAFGVLVIAIVGSLFGFDVHSLTH